jgi:hypothetical protein
MEMRVGYEDITEGNNQEIEEIKKLLKKEEPIGSSKNQLGLL